MLARRIIAFSADKAFGKQLAVALKAAGGAVELHATIDGLASDLAAPLVVIHLDGALAEAAPGLIARLTGETRVIAILPRSNLAAVVDIMQGSERVAGMMVADDFDTRHLSAMATRVLAGDIFGLEKMTTWGTQVHSCLVGDYQEKALAIARISEFAELMGVRRKYRESIEQCADEMMMNALYDAPVDEHGRHIFSEIPTKTRISLRVEQKVVVQYACDGKQFAISVRDAFGTLERATVLRYLHKCLHNEQQIDRKVGGAGLGLYLITSSSTDVYFNVLPGIATEALCTFDLEAPKIQLESFGFFSERIDAAGRMAAGPSRRLPAGASHPIERRAPTTGGAPRWLVVSLVAAIAITIGMVAGVAWRRLSDSPERTSVVVRSVPAGASIDIDGKNVGVAANALVIGELEVGRAYPIVGRLEGYEPRQAVIQPRASGGNALTLELVALAATVVLESSPSGAAVKLEGGAALGTTPVVVTTFTPGSTVALTFHKAGYQPTTSRLQVPRPGKETRLIQPLVVSSSLARIQLRSEPPGAQVIQNGQVLAGVTTPAEVLVEAGKPVRFTLALPNKVPATIEPFTPGPGADGVVRTATLVDGVALTVASNLEGAKATITGAPHCPAAAAPLVCVLAPGSYAVELVVPGVAHGRLTRTVKHGSEPQQVRFELGYVETAAGKLVQLGRGPGVRRAAFEAGTQRVTINDAEGAKVVTVDVKPGASVVVP